MARGGSGGVRFLDSLLYQLKTVQPGHGIRSKEDVAAAIEALSPTIGDLTVDREQSFEELRLGLAGHATKKSSLNVWQKQAKEDDYRLMAARIEDPNCKRILFDARQAALFAEMDTLPEAAIGVVRLPFDHFYLEFTEPITPPIQEPGFDDDQLRAMAIKPVWQESRVEQPALINDAVVVSVFLTSTMTHEEVSLPVFVDRTFVLSPSTGKVFIRRAWLDAIEMTTSHTEPPTDAELEWVEITDELREGHWFCDVVAGYGQLLLWIATYTMAKGVNIVNRGHSRPVRRWHERRNIPLPQPWHEVLVEPRFSYANVDEAMDSGRRHRFRYDVIGHLRMGRHKLGDGSYRTTVEWVPAHQRGLQHSLYIPKTYKVERGKTVAPAMRQLMGKETADVINRKEK